MEEIIEKLTEDSYWVFWDDKVYNSGIGHWAESKESIMKILEEGFYDGEGNVVEDFLITDYDLNTIYEQGEKISVYDTILPNTKLVGKYRWVNLENKGATDYAEEAVLMEILKDNEWFNSILDVYYEDENGEDKELDPKELVERIQQLKEQIISEYSLDDAEEEKESQNNEEIDYQNLLKEVSNMVWEDIYQNEEKTTFIEDIKEMAESDSSIRTESIQQIADKIEGVMKNKDEIEEFKGETDDKCKD